MADTASTYTNFPLTARQHSALMNASGLVDLVFKGYNMELNAGLVTNGTDGRVFVDPGAYLVGSRLGELTARKEFTIPVNNYFVICAEYDGANTTAPLKIVVLTNTSENIALKNEDIQTKPLGIRQVPLWKGYRDISGSVGYIESLRVFESASITDLNNLKNEVTSFYSIIDSIKETSTLWTGNAGGSWIIPVPHIREWKVIVIYLTLDIGTFGIPCYVSDITNLVVGNIGFVDKTNKCIRHYAAKGLIDGVDANTNLKLDGVSQINLVASAVASGMFDHNIVKIEGVIKR